MLDTTNVKVLLSELVRINPGVSFMEDRFHSDIIHASAPAWKLNLPEPFYFNEKNGITNKHKTPTGSYIAVEVLPLR